MNYNRYYLSMTEWVRVVIEYLVIDLMAAFLFFDSYIAILIGLTGFIPFLNYRKKEMSFKQKNILKDQFAELIGIVSGKMRGGMSCENAILDSYDEMESLYGKTSIICRELRQIEIRLTHQETLEECLGDLGKRSGVDDIYEFAQVFSIARSGSGRMRDVIEDTISMMREKSETESEIAVLIAGKQLEQKIMSVIPLVIIAYLKVATGEFMSILYHNVPGILVMSICLVIYISSYLIAERMVCIEV